MHNELQLLILDDNAADVLLMAETLRRADVPFRHAHVQTQAEFQQALQTGPPDLILSDHALPAFDGFAALALAHARRPGTPFIFVSGNARPEVVAEALSKGATDYVFKQSLALLPVAVWRARQRVEERARWAAAEAHWKRVAQELRDALVRHQPAGGLVRICAQCKRVRDEQERWVPLEAFLRRQYGATFSHGLCHHCAETLYPGVLADLAHSAAAPTGHP